MNNVVCLKWGDKYDFSYVNKLYAGVSRNTTLPFDFHCFTDNPEGIVSDVVIHPLPFADKLKGWWNKLYLFSKDVPILGRILYIDLDTVISGNIDDILLADGFVVLRDFYASMARGVGTSDIGSGLMSWDGDYSEIWERFMQNPTSNVNQMRPHGDQRWIQKFVSDRKYWQDVVPNQIISFKCHCVKGLPDDARVICYHGKPSIPESIRAPSRGWRSARIPASNWVRKYWYE